MKTTAWVGVAAFFLLGFLLVGVSHGGAETAFLAAAIVAYGVVQWKAARKMTGAWRFTSLLPVWFVGTCAAFFLMLRPATPTDWWWAIVVVGFVSVLAMLYVGLHWLVFKLVHADDRMARAMQHEGAPR